MCVCTHPHVCMHVCVHMLSILCDPPLSGQVKKTGMPEKGENPDQVDTLPYSLEEQFQESQQVFSPVPPMKSLSPSPSPPILKKSSQYSMVTTLDAEDNETHEKAEEEEPTHDACVYPGHEDVVIDIESDQECLMSPSKQPKTDKDMCPEGSMPHEKEQNAKSGPKDMGLNKPMCNQKTPADTQIEQVPENHPGGDFQKIERQLGSDDEMGQGATRQAFKVCVGWVCICIDSCIWVLNG